MPYCRLRGSRSKKQFSCQSISEAPFATFTRSLVDRSFDVLARGSRCLEQVSGDLPAIDFTLAANEKHLQSIARKFANDILVVRIVKADEVPEPQGAFQEVTGAYIKPYNLGFAAGFIPKQYGEGGSATSTFGWSLRKSAP
jgi:hypothetical protein